MESTVIYGINIFSNSYLCFKELKKQTCEAFV